MSCTEQQLLVDLTNYRDSLHWNYSSFEAMKRAVAPMACRIDFGVLDIFDR